MPNATATAELKKLRAARDRAYAALQEVKRKRNEYDEETQILRAQLSAKTIQLGPGGRHELIESPGPEVAKLEDEVKRRLTEPNPFEAEFETRRAEFHAADEALQRFLIDNLDELLSAIQVGAGNVNAELAEALDRLIEIGNSYASTFEEVKVQIAEVSGHDHRSAACDPRPAEWSAWARAARDSLDVAINPPSLSQYGIHRKAVVGHG